MIVGRTTTISGGAGRAAIHDVPGRTAGVYEMFHGSM
jgi:hypothetical protein